jgi:hypothetical protein
LVKRHVDLSFYRAPLIVSATFCLVGNTLYSYAAAHASFKLALLGRFLFGFGCSELLNRQLLHAALPIDSINVEVAVRLGFSNDSYPFSIPYET